jgi:hypothetical protein
MMAHEPGNIRIIFHNGNVRFHGKYCSRIIGLDLAFERPVRARNGPRG